MALVLRRLVLLAILASLGASACVADAGRADADRMLTAYQNEAPIHTESKALLAELQGLADEVQLLLQHPGWTDFAAIIAARPGIAYVEGRESSEQKTERALVAWSKRWQFPAREMLARYGVLAERSRVANERRLAQIAEERTAQIRRSEIMASAAAPWVREVGYRRLGDVDAPDTGLAAFLAAYYLDPLGLLRRTGRP